jgi:hypothetical protein
MQQAENSSIQQDKLPNFYCELCDFKCDEKRYLQHHFRGKKHQLATSLSNKNNNENNNENNEIQTVNTLLKIIEDLKNDKIQQQKIIEDLLDRNKIQEKTVEDLQSQNKMLLQLLCQKSEQNIEPIKPKFCKMQYLNETCKDALNLDNFLNSIEITSENFKNMEYSFADGISKNLIQIINTTKKNSLPFCCTNLRDKVIWIKIDDKWIEDKKFINLDKFISKYSSKLFNFGLPLFQKEYPDCIKSTSNKSNLYNYCTINCNDDIIENRLKVINKIIQLITVEK